jgi:hypothetical protein
MKKWVGFKKILLKKKKGLGAGLKTVFFNEFGPRRLLTNCYECLSKFSVYPESNISNNTELGPCFR